MKKLTKYLSRILSLALVICMLLSFAIGVSAATANTAVSDAANGVLQVIAYYRGNDGTLYDFSTGSAFLINDNTIVTCQHVLVPDEDIMLALMALEGRSQAEIIDRLVYAVTVNRDITINATILQSSVDMDFAILRLQSPLQTRSPLVLRGSSDVALTETVYAIGFPAQSQAIQSISKFTSSDVTITSGVVNKVATGASIFTGENYDYIQTSCKMTAGTSGGPMVDDNGQVIGICQGSTGENTDADDYYYAVAIDQVIDVCKDLGIVYTPSNAAPIPEPTTPDPEEPNPVPVVVDTSRLSALISEVQGLSSSDYTAESFSALNSALNNAISVLNNASATQDQVDSAVSELNNAKTNLQTASKNTLPLIIIIAVICAVVVVVVVVVVIVASSSKKKTAVPAYTAARVPTPPAPPSSNGFAPTNASVATGTGRNTGTVALNPSAGETTILSQGAGETTVLSHAVNGGTLIMRRTGERIAINAAEFTIGRERSRVSYCISGNTSISRVHVKLVVRNGVTFLVDQNAANGTFVNGVKATPHQEIALKDGDKVTLADEDFDFKA